MFSEAPKSNAVAEPSQAGVLVTRNTWAVTQLAITTTSSWAIQLGLPATETAVLAVLMSADEVIGSRTPCCRRMTSLPTLAVPPKAVFRLPGRAGFQPPDRRSKPSRPLNVTPSAMVTILPAALLQPM